MHIQNNLRIHGIVVVPAYLGCLFLLCVISSTALWEFEGLEIRHGIFWGLAFGPGKFLGFV